MNKKKSKSIERPLGGSQERPMHESILSPPKSGAGIKIGKLRPLFN